MRWGEWNKDGLVCVCVFQSGVRMAENWQINFSAPAHLLLLLLFLCSVLSLCVIPGDVNWLVSLRADRNWACGRMSEDGDCMLFTGKCHDFTRFL